MLPSTLRSYVFLNAASDSIEAITKLPRQNLVAGIKTKSKVSTFIFIGLHK